MNYPMLNSYVSFTQFFLINTALVIAIYIYMKNSDE